MGEQKSPEEIEVLINSPIEEDEENRRKEIHNYKTKYMHLRVNDVH